MYLLLWLQKSVFSLCMLEDGTLLSGGGNEIKAWDTMSAFKSVKERTVGTPNKTGQSCSNTGIYNNNMY